MTKTTTDDNLWEVKLGREYYPVLEDIRDWCSERFGGYRMHWLDRGPILWDMTTQFGYTWIWFHREEDYLLFTLTWLGKRND